MLIHLYQGQSCSMRTKRCEGLQPYSVVAGFSDSLLGFRGVAM